MVLCIRILSHHEALVMCLHFVGNWVTCRECILKSLTFQYSVLGLMKHVYFTIQEILIYLLQCLVKFISLYKPGPSIKYKPCLGGHADLLWSCLQIRDISFIFYRVMPPVDFRPLHILSLLNLVDYCADMKWHHRHLTYFCDLSIIISIGMGRMGYTDGWGGGDISCCWLPKHISSWFSSLYITCYNTTCMTFS
jgi:hypothetical protein